MTDDKKVLYSDYQHLPPSRITEEDLKTASRIMAVRKSVTPRAPHQVLYLVEDDRQEE